MTGTPLTLKSLLFADATKPAAYGIDLSPVMAVVAVATSALPSPVVAGIASAIKPALDVILEVGLGDVLQVSWRKLSALKNAIETTLKEQGRVELVPLLDHKITSVHQPHIDLNYGQQSLGQIKFDITLSLLLKGVLLEIREGRIDGLKAGICGGDGILAFAGKPLLRHTTAELALPGKLSFSPSSVQHAPQGL